MGTQSTWGYWAGIFCAVATQPMDNLVSMKGIPENKSKPWGQMASEMGTRDLFLKGLGTRVLMMYIDRFTMVDLRNFQEHHGFWYPIIFLLVLCFVAKIKCFFKKKKKKKKKKK